MFGPAFFLKKRNWAIDLTQIFADFDPDSADFKSVKSAAKSVKICVKRNSPDARKENFL